MNVFFDLPPAGILMVSIVGAAVAIYVPYGLVALARLQLGYDASAPRAMFDRLPDSAKRATWAHQNSFEMFSPFAAAALMVLVTAPHDQIWAGSSLDHWAGWAGIAFVVSRLTFAAFYIADIPWARSLSWAVSVLSTAALMGISLLSIPGLA